jgi:hypothetical protein
VWNGVELGLAISFIRFYQHIESGGVCIIYLKIDYVEGSGIHVRHQSRVIRTGAKLRDRPQVVYMARGTGNLMRALVRSRT